MAEFSIHFKTCVIFGGNGFIGSYFAEYLLMEGICDVVYLADIRKPDMSQWPKKLRDYFSKGTVVCVDVDVRRPIVSEGLPKTADLVCNFAAVHKQPGHAPAEYFATNIPGAENVCAWARQIGCERLIFTSSIAAYGNLEPQKDESSLTGPLSPYGVSKLAAEKIHIGWQEQDKKRQLLIVRPGVIFGHGEKGNVTRMLRAVLGRYFVYTGNRDVPKAGGYIKELCYSLGWMLERQERDTQKFLLYNFTMNPAPTLSSYVRAISRATGRRYFVPNIPFVLLLGISYLFSIVSLFWKSNPINPARVRKLLDSNNIVPGVLAKMGYQYHFTLDEAMKDWRTTAPEDWE